MTSIRVLRHEIPVRILHWLIVIEGILLGLTGMQLGGIWGIRVLPAGGSWAVHVTIGMAWILTSLFLLYHLIVSGEYRWYSLRRIPYGFRFLMYEFKAWFVPASNPKIEEIRYDKNRRVYIEKIMPTEIIVWWTFAILGVILALTGLAMAYPEQFSFVLSFFDGFKFIVGGGAYSITRSVHLLSMFIVLGIVILHIYATWVYKMIKAMITGYRDEPVVE
jgi:formate dehydrogenase subunit gamma